MSEQQDTRRVTYTGPAGQSVVSLGQLEPGKTYEVEATLAESLVASDEFWNAEGWDPPEPEEGHSISDFDAPIPDDSGAPVDAGSEED
jgi:hypothetical protein